MLAMYALISIRYACYFILYGVCVSLRFAYANSTSALLQDIRVVNFHTRKQLKSHTVRNSCNANYYGYFMRACACICVFMRAD